MKRNDEIIVEQLFNTSVEKVWNAITEIDQMRQWYFENIPSFKPEVGFETQFNVQSNSRNFLHMWKVTEIVPLKMLKYTWSYEGYPGDSLVVFELFEQNSKTQLRLTLKILENFSEEIPEFTRERVVSLGGHTLLKKVLKNF
ncbi:MAG: SRPBCC domain-containing protein [Bacteroidota bacterium]